LDHKLQVSSKGTEYRENKTFPAIMKNIPEVDIYNGAAHILVACVISEQPIIYV
jgi:hypothetical protein